MQPGQAITRLLTVSPVLALAAAAVLGMLSGKAAAWGLLVRYGELLLTFATYGIVVVVLAACIVSWGLLTSPRHEGLDEESRRILEEAEELDRNNGRPESGEG